MTGQDDLVGDRTAESALLAVCLISKVARAKARKYLTGGDFYEPRHEQIWDAMSSLDRVGEGVDPSSLLSLLRATHPGTVELIAPLVTWPAIPDHVETYARTIHAWAVRRRIQRESLRLTAKALHPGTDPLTLASEAALVFARIRDTGDAEDAQSVTAGEILDTVDGDREWVVHGLLERQDRLILTGGEGSGKSHLARQLAIMGVAGLDPFDASIHLPPIRALVVDCENTLRQVRRAIRPVMEFAAKRGRGDTNMVNFWCSNRLDLTSDRDLGRIHREMDACQPDLVIIGPLYRLSPRAIQTDDEAAPILAALDTIRERNVALILEAHAGHGTPGKGGGSRDMRPRGSSALLGWPEFGYGMRTTQTGEVDLVPWRGDRDAREWPTRLRQCNDGIRWLPTWQPDHPMPGDAWGA